MKTLIVNGSPRPDGGTATLCSRLAEALPGEVHMLRTYDEGISPCTDCRACWQRDGCAIEDGMQAVYRQIDEADIIVLASPIYFAEMTGSLLSWASRLQCLWAAKHFRGVRLLADKPRHGGVILVDGGQGLVDTAHAMGRRLLHLMGAQDRGLVYFPGTDDHDPTHPPDQVTAQLARLAESLRAPR